MDNVCCCYEEADLGVYREDCSIVYFEEAELA